MHEANFIQGKLTAIGLMSGTSMDGIDAAILTSDGERIFHHGPVHERPYSQDERKIISAAMKEAAGLDPASRWPECVTAAHRMITATHANAVRELLDAAALEPGDIELIGFHGQTLVHRPERGFTLQVGDGAALAADLQIPVVDQFRKADMAAGGQGAPLAPLYHQALVKAAGLASPVGVLNLGGVGNATIVSPGHDLLAFDTGPGNALLDDWVFKHTGAAMDKDGRLARAGRVDEDIVRDLLAHPFFKIRPPKSLDRNTFSADPLRHLSLSDGAATLCAFTARSVQAALAHLPKSPETWVICGGGRRNPSIMKALDEALPGNICSAEELGWRGDALEAEAFAFLAIRAVKGLCLSLPGTTGAPRPLGGGDIHPIQ